MNIPQINIGSRILSALIVVTLLMPIGIKITHIFEHEDHPLCSNYDTVNFHECETDCVLLKYNLQKHDFKSENFKLTTLTVNNFDIASLTYSFSYNYKALSFSLRGPPALV